MRDAIRWTVAAWLCTTGAPLLASDGDALARERNGEESGAPVIPAPPDPAAHRRALALLGTTGILLIPDSGGDRVMAFDAVTGDLVDADFIPTDATNLGTPKNAILAADGNSVLVSDQIEDVVQEYALNGSFLATFAPAGGANTAILDNIVGIAYRPNGNLLVTVTGGVNQDSVAEFDSAGAYLGNFAAIAAGGMDGPFDVHEVVLPGGVLTAGDFLVPAINSDSVHRLSATGVAQANFAAINNFPEQAFQVPTGPNAGNVLIANFSGTQEGIVELTSAGVLVDVYSVAGLGSYRGVYELPNGNLLVTSDSGVHEITRAEALVETKISVLGAQYIEFANVVAGPAIEVSKTVGTNPDLTVCAETDEITLPPGGGSVYYCYTVTNIGTVAFTLHDLDDDVIGPILNDFPFLLNPGASAFLVEEATVTQTTVNTGTWTAFNPPAGAGTGSATASDTATVNVEEGVPAISLVKTVGTNPDLTVCAGTDEITLPPGGGSVYYCYTVSNTGTVSFGLHDLDDDVLGPILNDFPYVLNPGDSAFLVEEASVTQTTVNTGTWTAFNPPAGAGTGSATASDTATVNVELAAPGISLQKTVGTDPDPNVCAGTDEINLPPGGGAVYYCFTVTNTGNVALSLHDLVDSELGSLLDDFPFVLLPGTSAYLVEPAVITEDTVNSATWTAFNAGPTDEVSASDTATVTVTPDDPSVLEIPAVSPFGLAALAGLLALAANRALRRARRP